MSRQDLKCSMWIGGKGMGNVYPLNGYAVEEIRGLINTYLDGRDERDRRNSSVVKMEREGRL